MEQVTFVIENKKDVNLLIALAGKLGIKKYTVSKNNDTQKKINLDDLFKTIDVGVDVSNFGDASLWQKETRKDKIFDRDVE